MTHRRLTDDHSMQVLRSKQLPLVHHIQFYSLFEKDVNTNSWKRISVNSYDEKTAYRVFNARLLELPLSRTIRPVRFAVNQAQGITRFPR